MMLLERVGKLVSHKLLYQIIDIDETKVIILPCQTMPIKGKSLKFTNKFALLDFLKYKPNIFAMKQSSACFVLRFGPWEVQLYPT